MTHRETLHAPTARWPLDRQLRVPVLATVLLLSPLCLPSPGQSPSQPVIKKSAVAVTFSADGSHVLAAHNDGTLTIWRRGANTKQEVALGGNAKVVSLAAARKLNLFAAGTDKGEMLVRPVAPFMPIQQYQLKGAATALAVSGYGTFAAVGTDFSIQLGRINQSQTSVSTLKGLATAAKAASLTDKQFSVLDTAGGIHVWDLASRKKLAVAANVGVSGVLVRSQQTNLVGGNDGIVRWLDPAPPVQLPQFPPHGEPGRAIVCSADGKLLASAAGKEVHVYDGHLGRLLKRLSGHSSSITCLAISADGKWLAAGGLAGSIWIWSTAKLDQPPFQLLGHTSQVNDLDFHPQRAELLSAGADGTIRIWALPQSAVELTKHAKPIAAVATFPSGDIVTAGQEGGVAFTSPDGKPGRAKLKLPQLITRCAVSPEGWLAVGDAAGDIYVFDDQGQPAGQLSGHRAAISGIGFDEQSKVLVSSATDGTLLHWQLPIQPLRSVPLKKGMSPRVAEFVSHGKLLLLASKKNRLTVLEPKSQQRLRAWSTSHSRISALASHESSGLVASADETGRIEFWGTDDMPRPAAILAHDGPIEAIRFNPTGAYLASAGRDGTIRLWNVIRPKRLDRPDLVPQVAESNFAGTLMLLISKQGVVRAVDPSTGTTAWQSQPAQPRTPTAIAFRRNDKQVAVGYNNGTIVLYNASTGAEEGIIGAHQGPVTSLAYDYRHQRLLSGGAEGVARVWQLTGVLPKTVVPAAANTKDLFLSSDGVAALRIAGAGAATMFATSAKTQSPHQIQWPAKVTARAMNSAKTLVAVGTAQGRLVILDLAKSATVATIDAAKTGVTGVSWVGSSIAVAGKDGQISLWKLTTTLKLIKRWPAHSAGHTCVLTTGTKGVVTAGADQQIKTWDLTGKLQSTLTTKGGPIRALTLGPSQALFGVLSEQGQVEVWHRKNKKQIAKIKVRPCQHLQITSDGTRAYTSDASGVVRYWDLTNGNQLEYFAAHRGQITDTVLLAGQKVLASAGLDGTVHHWYPAANGVVKKHVGGVTAVDFTRHGKNWLVTGGKDKRVVISADTGKVLRTIQVAAAVTSLSLHPQQSLMAVAAADGSLSTWRVVDGRPATKYSLSRNYHRLTFDRAGRRIAAAAADRLDIWNWSDLMLLESHPVRSGRFVGSSDQLVMQSNRGVTVRPVGLQQMFKPGKGAIRDLTFMSSSYLISAGDDKVIRQWTIGSGRLSRTFTGHSGSIHFLRLAQNQTRLVSASDDKTVRVWNLSTGQTLARIAHQTPVTKIAVSQHPTEAKVATVNDKREIQVWDLNTGQRLQRLGQHPSDVRQIMIAADEQTILSIGAEDEIRKWPLAVTGFSMADNRRVEHMCVVRGTRQYLTAGSDNYVKLWGVDKATVRSFSNSSTPVLRIAVSPDGQWVAGGGDRSYTQRTIYRWNLGSGDAQSSIKLSAAITALAYRPDSQRLAVATADRRLHILASIDGKLLESLRIPTIAYDLAYSRDGKQVLLGGVDGQLLRVAPRMKRQLLGHTGAVAAVRWGSNDQVFSTGADNSLRLWDLQTNSTVRSYTGVQSGGKAIALDKDAKWLAAISGDSQVRVWPVTDAEAPESPVVAPSWTAKPGSASHDITFSDDGAQVITSGTGGRVSVWDSSNGQLVEQLVGQSGIVYGVTERSAAAANGGWRYAAIAADKTIRVWKPTVTRISRLHDGPVHAATAFGQHLVTVGGDKRLVISRQGKQVAACMATEALTKVAASADGAILAAAGATKLWIWSSQDVLSQKNVAQPRLTLAIAGIGGLTVSGDGQEISAAVSTQVRRFQLNRTEWKTTELPALTGQTGTVSQMINTPHGTMTLGSGGIVRRWMSRDGGQAVLTVGQSPLVALTFVANDQHIVTNPIPAGWQWTSWLTGGKGNPIATGKLKLSQVEADPVTGQVATLDAGGAVQLWDTAGKSAGQVTLPKGITSITLSAGAKQVLLSTGKTVLLRDAKNLGQNSKVFSGHKSQVVRAYLNQPGTKAISLDTSGQLIIWNVQSTKRVTQFQVPCQQARAFAVTGDEKAFAVATDAGTFLLTSPGFAK